MTPTAKARRAEMTSGAGLRPFAKIVLPQPEAAAENGNAARLTQRHLPRSFPANSSGMKPWRQLVASGLGLLVAAAGMIGLSPELHVRWEHGGVGPAHRHTRAEVPPEPHERHFHAGPASLHPNALRSPAPDATTPEKVVQHSLPSFTHVHDAFGRSSDLVRWLVQKLIPASPDAGPDRQPLEHRHDSLTQLLVEGGIEVTPELSPTFLTPWRFVATATPPPEFHLPSLWFAPTASRGPPPTIG